MKHGQKGHNNSTGQSLDLSGFYWTLPDQKQEIVQARLAAIRELAGGVSHHYNNTLQIIMVAAELAAQHPDVPESVKNKFLDVIIQQSQQAAQLSRQLLDFSGQPVASQQLVDLVSLIKASIEQLERIFPENIRVSLAVDESKNSSYLLKANPDQIRQILTNLAANAKEAMPAGGEFQLHVSPFEAEREWRYSSRSANNDEHWIILKVSDTGAGIPDDIQTRIFDPFFTTKAVGQGTGLGLAQVNGIIKQSGGEIEVESQVGKGTTFSLYFPALSSSWQRPEQIPEKKASPQHKAISRTIQPQTTWFNP